MIVLLLLLLALFGHAVLWTGFVNRLHASAVPYRIVNCLSYMALAAVVAIPLIFTAWIWRAEITPDLRDWDRLTAIRELPAGWIFYLTICWIMAAIGIVAWMARRCSRQAADVVLAHDSRSVCLADRSTSHSPLLGLPGNQSLRIDIARHSLCIDRLHPDLDGFSIVHLSDLHFSGKVGKGYFEEVVRLCNELKPDLVAITGDLADKSPFIDWIPDTLGKLQSRCGVFYLLGNHDIRVDLKRLRATLNTAGLIDLGGCWKEIHVVKNAIGYPIVLAGNELPWFPPAADMRDAPARRADGQPLRILLSHSPDQFDWAVAADFDLVLAGHLHGGQFRLPLIGPMLSPSHKGVRYASGTFYSRPTVMHVSRGVSAEIPVRFNCEPELARLKLHSGPSSRLRLRKHPPQQPE